MDELNLPVTKRLPSILTKWGRCLKCKKSIGNRYGFCKLCEPIKKEKVMLDLSSNGHKNIIQSDDHFYNEFIGMEHKPYSEFLKDKQIIFRSSGFKVEDNQLWSGLFPHQRALTKYALRKGKAAIFAAVGLGKTAMEALWSKSVCEYTNKPVLILAPLYITYQTIKMIKDLMDYDIQYIYSPKEATENRVYITNYERLHNFILPNPHEFWGGIAADESSIFKGENSETFKIALKVSRCVAYKSCYSATPNPNSLEELGKQSEWLEIMSKEDMKATFFTFDRNSRIDRGGKADEWGIRPHAQEKFYRWLASWAMALNRPSDLGFSDDGYILPPYTEHLITVPSGYIPDGQLFFTGLKGITDRSKVRHKTLSVRCAEAAKMINNSSDQWLVWCELNDEADTMHDLIEDSVNVQGSDSLEKKIDGIRRFVNGEVRVLISKTKICGLGSNFQNCHKVAWVGLSDSFEKFRQGNGRVHRFNQEFNVDVYVFISEEEIEIYENVKRKETQAIIMTDKLIENADQYQREELDREMSGDFEYMTDQFEGKDYRIMLGDSIERIAEVQDNSIHLSIYSPPFGELFVYSPTERDLGNSASNQIFFEHYGYLVEQLLRITKPGRKTAVHVADIHARKGKDGFMGLKDFSGDVIRLYISKGWDYWGRIPIAKNPQSTAIRLKAHELMFATMKRDSNRLMPVQPDYFLIFSKGAPSDNKNPVLPLETGEMDEDDWIVRAGQNWNDPRFSRLDELSEDEFLEVMRSVYHKAKEDLSGKIWRDIHETDVLQYTRKGREKLNEDDTKHICPLQLEPVEWLIKLWTSPGETIFTPFMGIGTEVYQAVKFGRKGIGIELKPEYFYKAYENIQEAVRLSKQEDLFSLLGIEV